MIAFEEWSHFFPQQHVNFSISRSRSGSPPRTISDLGDSLTFSDLSGGPRDVGTDHAMKKRFTRGDGIVDDGSDDPYKRSVSPSRLPPRGSPPRSKSPPRPIGSPPRSHSPWFRTSSYGPSPTPPVVVPVFDPVVRTLEQRYEERRAQPLEPVRGGRGRESGGRRSPELVGTILAETRREGASGVVAGGDHADRRDGGGGPFYKMQRGF